MSRTRGGGLLNPAPSRRPLFVGSGKLLFCEGERARLRLIGTTSLPTGVVVMRYQPVAAMDPRR